MTGHVHVTVCDLSMYVCACVCVISLCMCVHVCVCVLQPAGGASGVDFVGFVKLLVMIAIYSLSKTSAFESLYPTAKVGHGSLSQRRHTRMLNFLSCLHVFVYHVCFLPV